MSFFTCSSVSVCAKNRGHKAPRWISLHRVFPCATRMRALLPFKLTAAQGRVLGEIETDMAGGQPMQRLVQGDVGSGKTMVAWLASLRAIEQGRQALWMAPTEILAEQHYRNLQKFAGDSGNFLGAAHGVNAGKREKGRFSSESRGAILHSSSAPTR